MKKENGNEYDISKTRIKGRYKQTNKQRKGIRMGNETSNEE
jgi:hypothetical protein